MHKPISKIHNVICGPWLPVWVAILLTGSTLPCRAQWTVDPPSWWGDLEGGRVELLVSGEDMGTPQGVNVTHDEVALTGWRPAALPGHVWVELEVGAVTEATDVDIEVVTERGRKRKVWLHVEPHLDAGRRLDAWDEAPLMYLIMPDRFANGNPENDRVAGMREQGVNRNEMYARHGGDLQGVMDHLPYLANLGVGAVWMTPVVENDLAQTSYHGYACTDSYAVDPRLGSLEDYKELTRRAHEHGIRIVHDWVPNHWGNLHRLLSHPVDSAWVHHWPGGFSQEKTTNYRSTTVLDPHGIPEDLRGFNDGWFDRMMPDMDQSNADLQRYMGTNILWWMAEVGIDGLRIDTYTYGDQQSMAAMTRRVADAFPASFMFAEAWVYGSAKQAALVEGGFHGWGDQTGLDGTVDFAWHFAMQEAVHEGEGWERGIGKVYEVLAEDFLYLHPENLVTFLDNHDTHRWIAEAGDVNKAKAGLAMLLLGRGIPCLYYGTELGFQTRCEPDGQVRQDMPGGWAEDKRTAFEASGRTSTETSWFQWVHGLATLRQTCHDVMTGKMEHTFPRQGVYAFARLGDTSRVVVVVNASSEPRSLHSGGADAWLEEAQNIERMQEDGTWVPCSIPGIYDALQSWECAVYRIQ
ncbi:MAG: alpha-amylase family glycosyl hydrolase [Bacteroidetes bacterium]|nr:alpha-amylase family glycosyl hydrolase [Bacteroidota bacterium]MDA0902782.1 alpha-amylase family glycosyl hydrolase [Bacteroidota bacterium]MDA1243070.1 alpha-amylase family glycosyl hydrolase [Bacteroidota bacterium]